LRKIDDLVEKTVQEDLKVFTKELTLKDALNLNGIRAVFGEIYPDPVRVVSVGANIDELLKDPKNTRWRGYSIELCGGTHLGTSKEAGGFVVVEEEATGTGVRRIVAVTGEKAKEALDNAEEFDKKLEVLKKSKNLEKDLLEFKTELEGKMVPSRKRIEFREEMDKLREVIRNGMRSKGEQYAEASKLYIESVVSGQKVHVGLLEVGGSVQTLTNTIKSIQEKHPNTAVLLVTVDREGKKKKLNLVAIVPDELVKRGLKADEWAKAVSGHVGGKGGGKPNTAQGSSDNIERVKEAIEFAVQYGNKYFQ